MERKANCEGVRWRVKDEKEKNEIQNEEVCKQAYVK